MELRYSRTMARSTLGAEISSNGCRRLSGFRVPQAIPVPVRKPAATINNKDFDLRDASVYASLFNKVCIHAVSRKAVC